MKLSAVLSKPLFAFRRGFTSVASRLQDLVGAIKAVQPAAAKPSGRLAIIIVSGIVVLLCFVIILMSLSPRSQSAVVIDTGPETTATAMTPGDVPRSGPALAAMLLIPGDDAWPYPLALEPKARYTESDAEAMRPDMEEVDISGLTRRRKAELETLFDAVD